MALALSAIKLADDYTFAFRSTTKEMIHAAKYHDVPTLIHGGLTNGESLATLSYYAISLLKYASNLGYVIQESLESIPSHFSSLFQLHAFLQSIGGIGAAANGFTFLRESISMIRQQIFQSIFKNHVWKGKGLADGLNQIADYNDSALRKVLPEWLYNDLQTRGGPSYLKGLVKQIESNDPLAIQEGVLVFEKMRQYSRRKQIMHALGWISAIVGIIASIGMVVAFPPAIISLLLIVSMGFGIAQYMVKKGWVDNPNDGFSFKLCLPAFIQKKLDPKPKPDFYALSGLHGFKYVKI